MTLHFCFKCRVRIEADQRAFMESPETGRWAHQTCPTVVWVTSMGGEQPLRMAPSPAHTLEGAQKACDARLEGTTLRPGTAWREYVQKAGLGFVASYTRDLMLDSAALAVGWQTVEAYVVSP